MQEMSTHEMAGEMNELPDTESIVASVRDWVAAWGVEVAAVDMVGARERFADDVVGFGTHASIVRGLDDLESDQWQNVWPTIERFAFRLDDLVVILSADGRQAVAVVTWDSVGFDLDRVPFQRPGRATVVLRRASPTDRWLGVHTHFSLTPSPPPR